MKKSKQKANPLVSVVVPVYNVEQYLNDCVDSILKQSYQNIEVILVDDGSKDNSGSMCDEIAKCDSRVRVIHKSNGGLSSARNAGIENARGEFITFIDSDDDITSDYVEYLFSMIKKDKTKMAIASYSVVHVKSDKTDVRDLSRGLSSLVLDTKECLSRMLCEEGFTVSACAKLYKKELFSDVLFPIGKLCEDNGTIYKLILKCDRISYGAKSIYNYYTRENSIMTSKFNKKRLDLLELTDIMVSDISKVYPSLCDVLEKRTFQARFSILRQMVFVDLDEELTLKKKEIIRFLRKNFWKVLKNKKCDKRDKLAAISLMFGEACFKLSWTLYCKVMR